MATKKPASRMKATIWTPTLRLDADGSIDGVISSAFWNIPSAQRRTALLEELHKADHKMLEIEAAKATAA